MLSSRSSSNLRKFGIDPKVASKTWNNLTAYSPFPSKSRSKFKREDAMDPIDKYKYQQIGRPQSNQGQINITKYVICCLFFFGGVLSLNSIFKKCLIYMILFVGREPVDTCFVFVPPLFKLSCNIFFGFHRKG